jgi:D-alanine--poly(phosphoribitol) ligase subunit 2
VSSTVDLTQRVSHLLRTVLSVEIASPDVDLLENGRLDSLAFVEILFGIEEEFGVDVGVGGFEIEDFRTVRSIAELVRRNTSGVA